MHPGDKFIAGLSEPILPQVPGPARMRVPPLATTASTMPAMSTQTTATDEEVAAELKRRRKLAREQKVQEAARAAAEAAEKERADAIRKAVQEKHAALTLLGLVLLVERSEPPANYECLCEFEKELTPLAKQFGYRIVRVGDGNRATIVKL